uniref:Uncharacterized protein n=1 Tax=Anguilla anguilla TaxID=7936 RepID=A0A0E9S332_ANGAN
MCLFVVVDMCIYECLRSAYERMVYCL